MTDAEYGEEEEDMEALIQREEDDREELQPPPSKSQSKSAASSPSAAGQREYDDVTAIPSLEKAPAESSLSPAEAEEEGGGFLPEVQAGEQEPSEDAAGAQSTSGRKRQRTQEEEQEEEAAFDAAAVADMEAAVHQHEQSKLTAPAPADKDVLTCNECGNLAYNVPFFRAFAVAVCNGCTAVHSAAYRLITKSTATSSYLLSDSDLQPLPFLLKANPSRGSFANMKLYRERDVLQAMERRWGGEDGVREERERREKDRMTREVQKRRKGRLAAEKERKVREYRVDRIDSSSKGHRHQFVDLKQQGKQRCSECGFTLEYEEL